MGRLPIVAVIMFLALPALGTTDCDVFENHSGHVPGSYDYAVFTEIDPAVEVTRDTNGQDIFEDPAAHGAGDWWTR